MVKAIIRSFLPQTGAEQPPDIGSNSFLGAANNIKFMHNKTMIVALGAPGNERDRMRLWIRNEVMSGEQESYFGELAGSQGLTASRKKVIFLSPSSAKPMTGPPFFA